MWRCGQEVMAPVTAGALTVVVRQRWAHTSLSPAHRTTAVGEREGGEREREREVDLAGIVHLLLRGRGECASLLSADFLAHGHHLRGHIHTHTPRTLLPGQTLQRREGGQNFWLIWPRNLGSPETCPPREREGERQTETETGWDRCSSPSPCAWAPLSRSVWKVSGERKVGGKKHLSRRGSLLYHKLIRGDGCVLTYGKWI